MPRARQQADHRADGEDRQHHGDAIPGRAADAADLPEAERLQHVDAGEQDRADQRDERRGRGRGAGERELQRGRAAAPERADGVDEDRRRRGAGDRRPACRRTGSATARRTRADRPPPARRPPRRPRMPGSASGLRVTACIAAPDSASAAPTSDARAPSAGSRATDGRLRRRCPSSPPSAARISPISRRRATPNATDATHSSSEQHDRDGEPRQAHRCRAPQRGGVRQRCGRRAVPLTRPGRARPRGGRSTRRCPSRSTAATGSPTPRAASSSRRIAIAPAAIAGICDSSGSACSWR